MSFRILKSHASFNSSIQKGSFRIYLQLFHFSFYCHSKTDHNSMCDSATSELLLEGDHIKRKSVYFTDTFKFTHKGSNVNVCRKFIKICQFLNCVVIFPLCVCNEQNCQFFMRTLFIFHLPVSQIIELLTKQIDDVI